MSFFDSRLRSALLFTAFKERIPKDVIRPDDIFVYDELVTRKYLSDDGIFYVYRHGVQAIARNELFPI